MQVQLSTYGNHIGENMNDLYTFLETRLKGELSVYAMWSISTSRTLTLSLSPRTEVAVKCEIMFLCI